MVAGAASVPEGVPISRRTMFPGVVPIAPLKADPSTVWTGAAPLLRVDGWFVKSRRFDRVLVALVLGVLLVGGVRITATPLYGSSLS